MSSLSGKTLFITGASRGIGKAIAIRAARDGANIIVAAKTSTPHPKLPGTIYSAADDIRQAGGRALPVICDVRDENQVVEALAAGVREFGGIDIVVNNASAISLTGTQETSAKRFDLMHDVNVRGTWLVSRAALPYLLQAQNPHILNLAPPLIMDKKWFAPHTAYTMAKYGMSMCVLGMAEEFVNHGIAVNALWPLTLIQTAALQVIDGASQQSSKQRKPEIVADAAHTILTKGSREFTGNFCIDEIVLRKAGVTDLNQYAVDPTSSDELQLDFFLDDAILQQVDALRSKL